jgi:Ca2+-binding RTX toxin-like protein
MSKPSGNPLPYKGNGPATQFVASLAGNFSDQDRKSGLLTPETTSSRLSFQKLLYNVKGSRSIKPDFNRTLPYDEITFFDQGAGGDFVFAIEPAPGRGGKFEIEALEPANSTRASRRFYDPTDFGNVLTVSPYPWQNVAGIVVNSVENSNDLILPYGTGGLQYSTIVDRGVNYINARNGQDVVIGGYGQDTFGSSVDIKNLKELAKIDTTSRERARGSKFYVGGSSEDVLAGGLEADFLVGDRLNGYELYLPTSRLNGIPDTWKNHLEAIKSYQPSTFQIGKGSQGFDLVAKDESKTYPLWIPGNDIIRGYEGDDIIHGDDNTISQNLFQLPTIRKWLSNTPRLVVDAGGINNIKWSEKGFQLGADFIDGGAGNDQIYAGIGADRIIGGYGSDVIDTGPQIITPGYNPFFGPKVIFGGNADIVTGEWVKDTSEKSPDLFVIGALIDTEKELSSSITGELDTTSAERKTMAESLAKFEKAWEAAEGVVSNIPKVGGAVVEVVKAVTAFLKISDPKPVPVGDSPQADDAVTIIRDFDENDILSINVPNGANLQLRRGEYNIGGSDKNPLTKGLFNKKGVYFEIEKSAGNAYKRLFLEGVTELATIRYNQETDFVSWTFGGKSFIGYDGNNDGNPYKSQTIYG